MGNLSFRGNLESQRFYKLTNRDCKHHGFQYQEGHNTDVHPWNVHECSRGGFYITPIEHFYKWLTYRDDLYYVWDAAPAGLLVNSESDGTKVKCHSVYLSNRRLIRDMEEWKDPDLLLKMIIYAPSLIRYIQTPSIEVQLAAVYKDVHSIVFIEFPSIEAQLAAVRSNELGIQYIPNPSVEVQLAAVQQNGHAIVYILNPSTEVQLAAVQQNGHAISNILNPSVEVQLAAVRNDKSAIHWIQNPSIEVQQATGKCPANKKRKCKCVE